MKYRLINIETKEEHLCEKVTKGDFDYHVSYEEITNYCWVWSDSSVLPLFIDGEVLNVEMLDLNQWRKVIATTNPNFDIPKIVDEVVHFANEIHQESEYDKGRWYGRIEGYNKAKETHFFSEEDMIEFAEWYETSEEAAIFWRKNRVYPDMSGSHNQRIRENRRKLFQLWKEQRTKTLYFK